MSSSRARKYVVRNLMEELPQKRNVATRATINNLREKYGDDALDDATNAFANAVYDGEAKAEDEANWTVEWLKRNYSDSADDVRPPKPYRPAAVEGRTMSTTATAPKQTALEEFNERIDELVGNGMSRAAATSAVVKSNPALHRRVIDDGRQPKPAPQTKQASSPSKAKIDALVADKVATGMEYPKAYAQVLRENNDLRQQWVDEENAARRAG